MSSSGTASETLNTGTSETPRASFVRSLGSVDPPQEERKSPTKDRAGSLRLAVPIDASTDSVAAMSAKLALLVPQAESEIVRLNREALLNVTKRGRTTGKRTTDTSTGNAATEDSASYVGMDEANLSAAAKSLALKGSMAAALHESIIAEEWVNVHLETTGAYLLPAADIQPLISKAEAVYGSRVDDSLDEEDAFAFRKTSDGGPLARAGIDRAALYRLGMPKDLVDRLYRALYVYTNGFHNIINEIASHCPPPVEKHVSSNVWLTFLLLLEQCEDGKYEMAMLKFKQATEQWRKQQEEEFAVETKRMDAQLTELQTTLAIEMARSSEKSELISKLATDNNAANIAISDHQREIAAQAEQIRLLRLEILVHEDDEKKLNEHLDDARKDYEVANSERFNALTERYTLEEEIRKLHQELDRIETEKASYAKRMHETLFMNQALRAGNETVKQNVVVLTVEKEKLTAERQSLNETVERLKEEIQQLTTQKTAVEDNLTESERKQEHLEERLHAMKEQLDIEMENNTRMQQTSSTLNAQIDEERAKIGVLEAKVNLLTVEKQNTGMRAQDKLRIERLLNQKLELENIVESLKMDRAKDQEQIWNLRASLEALDTEMQHSKRVFSAGQQAFLHSERTCEQLRHQLHDLEKNYEKSTKSLTSLKERFKLYEDNSKEQITKLEVELKVTASQLREVSYANRDNTTLIGELNKSLELAAKEVKMLKGRLESVEGSYVQLKGEKEEWQRDRKQRDLQYSTSKNAIHQFIRSLQHILALVKRDEYPLDEALRELLRMVAETFGNDLAVSNLLDEEDQLEEFEEEDSSDDDDHSRGNDGHSGGGGGGHRGSVAMRGAARRKGLSIVKGLAEEGKEDDEDDDGDDDDEEGDGSKGRKRRVSRMSRFRKSKLETRVERLTKDLELKVELVASLEKVICTQADEILQLSTSNAQQMRWLKLNENQKGMLRSDIDNYYIILQETRSYKRKLEAQLADTKIMLVMETNRAFQLEQTLRQLRLEFDMQQASNEDLLGRIWREYQKELFKISQRRDREVQATVVSVHIATQTMVPTRNPATERPRMAAMQLPLANPASADAETILNQLNEAAKLLLPGVETELGLDHFQMQLSGRRSTMRQSFLNGARRTSRDSTHGIRPDRRKGRGQRSVLPTIEDDGFKPHIVRHVNEFGTRHDVLISAGLPPFFGDQQEPTSAQSSRTASSQQTTARSPRLHTPHKPLGARKHAAVDHHARSHGDRIRHGSPKKRAKPTVSATKATLDVDVTTTAAPTGGLRYNGGFLRAGMEVLRNSGAHEHGGRHDDRDEDPAHHGVSDDDFLSGSDEGGSPRSTSPSPHASIHHPLMRWGSIAHSPGRLETSVRDFQRDQEQQMEYDGNEVRHAHPARRYRRQNSVDAADVDPSLADEAAKSPFVPGVLYPIIPHQ